MKSWNANKVGFSHGSWNHVVKASTEWPRKLSERLIWLNISWLVFHLHYFRVNVALSGKHNKVLSNPVKAVQVSVAFAQRKRCNKEICVKWVEPLWGVSEHNDLMRQGQVSTKKKTYDEPPTPPPWLGLPSITAHKAWFWTCMCVCLCACGCVCIYVCLCMCVFMGKQRKPWRPISESYWEG